MKALIKKYQEDLKALNVRLEANLGKPVEKIIIGEINMLEKVIKDLKDIK